MSREKRISQSSKILISIFVCVPEHAFIWRGQAHGSQKRYVEVEEQPYQVLGYHNANALFQSDGIRKAHYLFLSLVAVCVNANGTRDQRESIYHPIRWTANKRKTLQRTEHTKRFSIALPFRTDTCDSLAAPIYAIYIWFVHWTAISRRPEIRRSSSFCLKIKIWNEFKSLRLHHHRPPSSFPPFRVYFIILNIQQTAPIQRE